MSDSAAREVVEAYLFIYKLNGMDKSKRNLFYYALSGRPGKKDKAFIKQIEAVKVGRNAIIVVKDHAEKFKKFLSERNISYMHFPVHIPENIFRTMKMSLKN